MQANVHGMRLVGLMAAAVALGTACGRRDEPASPSTPMPEPAAAAPASPAAAALPVPTLPKPPRAAAAATSDEEMLLGEQSVWWNIQPTGAVVHVSGGRTDLVVTALTGRVETRVATGFYSVEISADGHETWGRRMPLGGSSTNQTVSLFPLPPPPTPVPVDAVAATPTSAPEPPPTTRPVRDLRKALEETESNVETTPPPPPAQTSPVADVASAEPDVEEPSPPPPPQQQLADDALLPTRLVRGVLESTVAGDTGLFSEPMTLSIGTLVRHIDAGGFAINYDDIGDAPISVRVRNYDVRGPAAAPAVAPAGVARLVYRATPHLVSIRFPDLDAVAVPYSAATGRPLLGYDASTRTLRAVPPYMPLDIVIRRPGHRIQAVHVDPQKPAARVSLSDVHSIPLPAYGHKGDRQVIDIGDGVDLSLIWVPGGQVEEPSGRGTVVTVPRGFWISERPVTRRQWRAALGGILPDKSGRPDGDFVSIARTGFAPFAQSLMTVEPRMAARLPRVAELRLAAQAGLRNVNPAAELTLADPGAPERATGVFHVVVAMRLDPPQAN